MADEADDTAENAQDASATSPEGEAAQTGAEESAAADSSSASSSQMDDDASPEGEQAPAEPVVQLPPKERRRQARSKHKEARPSRTPEQRHAERLEERQRKAARRRARRLQERTKAAERRASAPPPAPLAPVRPPVEPTPKVLQGVVVSHKAEKTITVRIDVVRRHRRYEKIVRSSSTIHAHDENNDAHEGDRVRVIESRPRSRTKRWALVDVLERAQ